MSIDKQELVKRIEDAWISRAKFNGRKHGTRAYLNAECEFFMGAAAAIHHLIAVQEGRAIDDNNGLSSCVPNGWFLMPMSGQPIVDKERFSE